ncbi:N-acetylmuramoyl-L-alanine amidase [Paenibacillus sp.]|uniref:N-acetylmuramoyl-L-alanine amidase n=1 Tax=Paenibacillus sp. TaxID=58172 RepID=UPI002D71967F|nr:N-acetylmuramoyl-L-alanine amidase [Paenibacillus sp.]HZG85313.1 N-acetylmuramoyl-L-alanine amidase [Paenibacillus sp.]
MRNGWKTLSWALGGLVAAAVWTAAGTPATALAAEKESVLFVDGKESELSAVVKDKVPYISLEAAASLGAKVKAETGGDTYTITSGNKEVRFTMKEKRRFVDGTPVTDEQLALQVDKRVYVPAAWLKDMLQLKIVTDRFTSSVYVFRQQDGGAKTYSAPAAPPAGQTPVGAAAPSIGSQGAGAVKPSAGAGTNAPSGSAGTNEGVAPAAGAPMIDAAPGAGAPVTVVTAPPTMTALELSGDSLRIATTGEVSPNVFVLKSPNRIVVDLPNATIEKALDGSVSGSVAVSADHPYVAGIRYSLFAAEPSTVRVVIDLKAPKPYRLVAAEDGTGAVLHFTEAEPVRVMIDAGHGGTDPGAISVTGKFEKNLTMPIALKVYERLSRTSAIEPVLVRSDDTYSSPADRAKAANQADVDLFISIHANTAPSASVSGTETYYWRDDSLNFANAIHKALVKTIGSPDRKVKKERFVVVRDTTMPAVLLELGFLTNPSDEAKLYNEEMQNRIADTIVETIKSYYSIP